ncbi:Las1-like-domain-containing protein [Lipomyces arxii]|uniref:Las1-like-domain-containing protein n=1 Tax=Lipomyces arxii TaxID=56418 RepID=UPI0034CD8A2D
MSRHPKFNPFADSIEFQSLHAWFYEFPLQRERALSLVNAYETRGHVPYGIECTALLASAITLDRNESENYLAAQLAYSSAIIRFVNGFLDQHQNSQYAMPLHALALKIGMPTMFVELRHACTHEKLPSLDVLRSTANLAIKWLDDRYWTPEMKRMQKENLTGTDRVQKFLENWIKRYSIVLLDQSVNDEEDDDDYDELEVEQASFGSTKYQKPDRSSPAVIYGKSLDLFAQLCLYEEEATQLVGIPAIFQNGISNSRPKISSLRSIQLLSPLVQLMPAKLVDTLLQKCLVIVAESLKKTKLTQEIDEAFIQIDTEDGEDPFVLHAKNWINHILTHPKRALSSESDHNTVDGFSIMYRKFVLACIKLSAPNPTIRSILRLAKKSFGNGGEVNVDVLLDSYSTQVDLLFGSRSVIEPTELRNNGDTNGHGSPSMSERRAKRKRGSVDTAATTESSNTVDSWTEIKGTWTPRPIGVL